MKPKTFIDLADWYTPKELAAHFGCDGDTVYLWRVRWIPDTHPKTGKKLIHYGGAKKIFFHPDVIPLLEEIFARRHE